MHSTLSSSRTRTAARRTGFARRRALPPALLAALAGAASADLDLASAPVYVETGAALPGQSVRVTIRTQLPGAPVFVAFGNNPFPIALGGPYPVLLTGVPIVFVGGVAGLDGLFTLNPPIAAGWPAGLEAFLQAAVVDAAPFAVHGSTLARIAPNGAPASFASAALPAATTLYVSADVDWADLDKDGRNDVIVASEGGPGARPLLLVNQGATFVDQAATRLPAVALRPTAHVEAADVDLDGRLDLFLAGGHDATAPLPDLLAIENGGVYALDASFPPGQGIPLDAEFGDVDGDGDPDLVLAGKQDPDHLSEAPDGVALYRNAPAGFTPDTGFASLPATTPLEGRGGVALGDVDNDGDLDLFVARGGLGGAQNLLLLNDGLGNYFDFTATALPQISDNTTGAQLGDVDGDGWLDVVAANSPLTGQAAVDLYRNLTPLLGSIVFADATAALPASLGVANDVRLGLDLADVEGDGDLDIAFCIHQLFNELGQLDGDAVLLLNQGGEQGGAIGTFAQDATFDLGGSGFVCPDLAFGDADGDGDPDLYLGSDGDLFETLPPVDAFVKNPL